VNYPYWRNAALTEWAFHINHWYSERFNLRDVHDVAVEVFTAQADPQAPCVRADDALEEGGLVQLQQRLLERKKTLVSEVATLLPRKKIVSAQCGGSEWIRFKVLDICFFEG
jgi:hypothetical protein